MKSRRKGKPLLVAAVGVALVTYACGENHPVGNLRGPDNPPPSDAGPPPEEGGTPVVLEKK